MPRHVASSLGLELKCRVTTPTEEVPWRAWPNVGMTTLQTPRSGTWRVSWLWSCMPVSFMQSMAPCVRLPHASWSYFICSQWEVQPISLATLLLHLFAGKPEGGSFSGSRLSRHLQTGPENPCLPRRRLLKSGTGN